MLSNTEIIRKTGAGYKRANDIDDGQQWLSEIKARLRKEKRITEIVFLSPSRAAALLNANPDNRTISDRTAETYAADIANGRWVFNGEPIILAETGELNDGQHRCRAVVLAGKGVEVLLVAGVARATRTTVDMGKARTTGDFLHMHQVEHANNVAAAASMILAFEKKLLIGRRGGKSKETTHIMAYDLRPTKQELLSFSRENGADIQRALKAIDAKKASVVSTYSRCVGMLCIIARHAKDWNGAIRFIGAVVDGDELKRGSAEYVTRERLLAEKRGGTLAPIRFMEIVARGWNASRTGQKVTRLQLAGYVPELAR